MSTLLNAVNAQTDTAGITCSADALKYGQCSLNIYDTIGIRENAQSLIDEDPATSFIQDGFLSATYFIGTIVTVSLIVSGLMLVFAGANESLADNGKKGIKYSILGLLLVLFSYSFIKIIVFVATDTEAPTTASTGVGSTTAKDFSAGGSSAPSGGGARTTPTTTNIRSAGWGFNAGGSSLKQVVISKKAEVPNQVASMEVSVQTALNGSPSGVKIASSVVSSDTIKGANQTMAIRLNAPLSPNQQYFVVVTPVGTTGNISPLDIVQISNNGSSQTYDGAKWTQLSNGLDIQLQY